MANQGEISVSELHNKIEQNYAMSTTKLKDFY